MIIHIYIPDLSDEDSLSLKERVAKKLPSATIYVVNNAMYYYISVQYSQMPHAEGAIALIVDDIVKNY